MKKLIATLTTCIILFSTGFSQDFSIIGGLGGLNYAGDLQRHSLTFLTAHPTVSVGAGYNVLPRLAINANFMLSKLSAFDINSKDTSLYNRNLSFETGFFEAALTAEYTLFDVREDYDLYGQRHDRFAPYINAGISLFHFNPYTHDSSGNKYYLQPLGTEGQGMAQYPDRKFYSLWSVGIPLGIGIKYAINDNLILAGEFQARLTFTDYIDDVSSINYADTALLRQAHGAKAAELSFRGNELPSKYYPMYAQRGNNKKHDDYYGINVKLIYYIPRVRFNQ